MGWLNKLFGGSGEGVEPRGHRGGDDDEPIDVEALSLRTQSRWERAASEEHPEVEIYFTKESGAAVLGRLRFGAKVIVPITGVTRLGRDDACNIIIRGDREVSRRHTMIRHHQGKLLVTDDGATNGTHVNGNPVRKGDWQALSHGDKLNLGSRVAFVVVLEPAR